MDDFLNHITNPHARGRPLDICVVSIKKRRNFIEFLEFLCYSIEVVYTECLRILKI